MTSPVNSEFPVLVTVRVRVALVLIAQVPNASEPGVMVAV
jgi:hypothetical protein